jgi:hypothetical protein
VFTVTTFLAFRIYIKNRANQKPQDIWKQEAFSLLETQIMGEIKEDDVWLIFKRFCPDTNPSHYSYLKFLESFSIYTVDKNKELNSRRKEIIQPIIDKATGEKPYPKVSEKERETFLAIEAAFKSNMKKSGMIHLKEMYNNIAYLQKELKFHRWISCITIFISIVSVIIAAYQIYSSPTQG